MRIIIASDSHGRNSILDLIPYYEEGDHYIFCGDLQGDPNDYDIWKMVEGNCDYFYGVPQAFKLDLENGHRVLVLHSHQAPGWPKEARKEQLAEWAKEEECDIVCYGHTHVSDVDTIEDVLLINPGSLSRPRDGKEPSYCVLTIDDENLVPELIFESDWKFQCVSFLDTFFILN